jgi:hypothetical protein
MKKFFPIFIFSTLLIICSFFFSTRAQAQINPPVDMHGWAWSDTIGWISFNCAEGGLTGNNICGTSDYKVQLLQVSAGSPWYRFTGQAWSDNVGWVHFYSDSTNTCPPPTNPNYTPCSATVNVQTGAVVGWARAIAPSPTGINTQNGGWNGWIHMSGANHTSPSPLGNGGVTYCGPTPDSVACGGNPNKFVGFAWGGTADGAGSEVVGWIDFSQVTANLPITPPPLLDVCTNVPGNQATMPPGYVLVAGNCVIKLDLTAYDLIAGTDSGAPPGSANTTLTTNAGNVQLRWSTTLPTAGVWTGATCKADDVASGSYATSYWLAPSVPSTRYPVGTIAPLWNNGTGKGLPNGTENPVQVLPNPVTYTIQCKLANGERITSNTVTVGKTIPLATSIVRIRGFQQNIPANTTGNVEAVDPSPTITTANLSIPLGTNLELWWGKQSVNLISCKATSNAPSSALPNAPASNWNWGNPGFATELPTEGGPIVDTPTALGTYLYTLSCKSIPNNITLNANIKLTVVKPSGLTLTTDAIGECTGGKKQLNWNSASPMASCKGSYTVQDGSGPITTGNDPAWSGPILPLMSKIVSIASPPPAQQAFFTFPNNPPIVKHYVFTLQCLPADGSPEVTTSLSTSVPSCASGNPSIDAFVGPSCVPSHDGSFNISWQTTNMDACYMNGSSMPSGVSVVSGWDNSSLLYNTTGTAIVTISDPSQSESPPDATFSIKCHGIDGNWYPPVNTLPTIPIQRSCVNPRPAPRFIER